MVPILFAVMQDCGKLSQSKCRFPILPNKHISMLPLHIYHALHDHVPLHIILPIEHIFCFNVPYK